MLAPDERHSAGHRGGKHCLPILLPDALNNKWTSQPLPVGASFPRTSSPDFGDSTPQPNFAEPLVDRNNDSDSDESRSRPSKRPRVTVEEVEDVDDFGECRRRRWIQDYPLKAGSIIEENRGHHGMI